jgi:hypothetical protein
MLIRPYVPGDDFHQVRIYNLVAATLPAFKPAVIDEVLRRYRASGADPGSRLYAVESGQVVGYILLNPNGRISYPWCLPQHQALREPLLQAALTTMRQRHQPEAWAAYRADWAPVLSFFRGQGFPQTRLMINYAAELSGLPNEPVPEGQVIRPLERADLPKLLEIGRGLFAGIDVATLERFYWNNPFFGESSLFALTSTDGAVLRGAALLIGDAGYADPSRIDPAMPCFRLGVLGTERERHKRVNGLFSCVFVDEPSGETLLGEAVRRLESSGLRLIAAQASTDQPALVAFHDRFLNRQGLFPILSRNLSL